jgi:hypothetical protein
VLVTDAPPNAVKVDRLHDPSTVDGTPTSTLRTGLAHRADVAGLITRAGNAVPLRSNPRRT